MATTERDERRRLYLRVATKLMLAIGAAFLLVPFLSSLPWLQDKAIDNAALLHAADIASGETRRYDLAGGIAVHVTRNSPARAAQLRGFPPGQLWFPSAPGLADAAWFVVAASSALDETVRFLPAQGAWPGGFVAASGSAWDVAGRALKPWPGHPTGYGVKVQNLPPLPFRVHDGGILLPAAIITPVR